MTSADWTAIAAVATSIMAVATFVLARATKTMAKATEKTTAVTENMVAETKAVADATLLEAKAVEAQVEQAGRQVAIASEALRASSRPWLVWEPTFEVQMSGSFPMGERQGTLYNPGVHYSVNLTEQGDAVKGWFTVRNVGNGLALLDMAHSLIYPRNGRVPLDDVHPSVMTPVLPPGAMVDVEFEIPGSKAVDGQRMTVLQFSGGGPHFFTVSVAYGAVDGEPTDSATFRAHSRNGQGVWSIFEVEYKLGGGRVITTRRYG